MPDNEQTEYTPESVNPVAKRLIDALDQVGLCRAHRFNPSSHPFFTPRNYPYFKQRFNELGGMTPEISKFIGWNPGPNGR